MRLRLPLKSFLIFIKIPGDIYTFVFVAVIIETGDKLFSGINDTGDKLSPVSLLPAVIIAGVIFTGSYAL